MSAKVKQQLRRTALELRDAALRINAHDCGLEDVAWAVNDLANIVADLTQLLIVGGGGKCWLCHRPIRSRGNRDQRLCAACEQHVSQCGDG